MADEVVELSAVPATAHGATDEDPVPCLWSADVLLLNRAGLSIMAHWRRASPPVGLAGVVGSLIIEDGVLLETELRLCVEQIANGNLFAIQDQVLVDTVSDQQGIRRCVLSLTTQCLIQRLTQEQRATAPSLTIAQAVTALLKPIETEVGQTANLKFLLDAISATSSLYLPGPLHAWMTGKSYVRTARPETIARHLSGHPEFHHFMAVQPTKFRTRSSVAELLSWASNEIETGSGNARVLRELDARLAALLTRFEDESREHTTANYCRYLTKKLDTVATLRRYESAIRPFIKSLYSSHGDTLLREIDWRAHVDNFTKAIECAEPIDQAPTRAALNHFLTAMGVDTRVYRRRGAPASVMAYADVMCDAEVERALSTIYAHRRSTGDVFDRAALVLELTTCLALRSDEVVFLRLQDISLDEPRVIIREMSGAELKSASSNRSLVVSRSDCAQHLRALVELKQGQFPEKKSAFLIGDTNDSHDDIEEVLSIVTNAKIMVSGSPHFAIHDGRHHVLSKKFQHALSTDTDYAGNTLQNRQSLYTFSTEAGHADVSTSLENYVCGFDFLRRDWMAKLNAQSCVARSVAFIAAVTCVPPSTYRKRISRGQVIDENEFSRFLASRAESSFGSVDLSKKLDARPLHVTLASAHSSRENCTATAIRVVHEWSGRTADTAAFLAQLPAETAERVSRGLKDIHEMRGEPFVLESLQSAQRAIEFLNMTRLPLAFSQVSWSTPMIAFLSRAIDCDGHWRLTRRIDIESLVSLLATLSANGIFVELRLRRGSRSADDFELRDRLLADGFVSVRFIPSRHFAANCVGEIIFQSKCKSNKKSYVFSRHLTCAVGASFISKIALQIGAKNEQRNRSH